MTTEKEPFPLGTGLHLFLTQDLIHVIAALLVQFL
jgi:hypothetical protein